MNAPQKTVSLGLVCFLTAATGLFPACSSEPASAATKQKETSTTNHISFRVNGEVVQTSGWNISRFDMGKGIGINVTSNMHEDKRTVAFNINGDGPGRYSLSQGSRGPGTAYGSYKPDYEALPESYSFTEGEIVITSMDTVAGSINASFSGTAKKGEELIRITEGKIVNGQLRPGITRY